MLKVLVMSKPRMKLQKLLGLKNSVGDSGNEVTLSFVLNILVLIKIVYNFHSSSYPLRVYMCVNHFDTQYILIYIHIRCQTCTLSQELY
jgi:hypothetical protein